MFVDLLSCGLKRTVLESRRRSHLDISNGDLCNACRTQINTTLRMCVSSDEFSVLYTSGIIREF